MKYKVSGLVETRIIKFLIVYISVYLIFVLDSFSGQPFIEYTINPYVIEMHSSQHIISGRGGIIVWDVNNDGLFDYIVSTKEGNFGDNERATLCAYDHNGNIIWLDDDIDIQMNGNAENYGLPGWHGPGVTAGDVDGDGESEVLHLNTKNEIVIRNGNTGQIERKIYVPLPGIFAKFKNSVKIFTDEVIPSNFKYAKKKVIRHFLENPKRWSHLQIVNLQGEGDNEVILQADPLPFRWLKAVSLDTGNTLWEFHEYKGCNHNGFRAADIDGDGFDEVVGGNVIDHDGTLIKDWEYRKYHGHLDSLYINDVLPDEQGLEWVVTEEIGGVKEDDTALLGKKKVYFYHSFNGWEPQNAVIGEFDISYPGLEIWCRSRFDYDQRPWVIDSKGNTIANYRLNDLKPTGWSEEGIEVISSIDWTGSVPNYIAAQERHAEGKIAIINPMTGQFLHWWDENSARIYVADVAGDYREEIIVLNSLEKEIRIYWNPDSNKNTRGKRYWDENYYKRQKLNYNYYSP